MLQIPSPSPPPKMRMDPDPMYKTSCNLHQGGSAADAVEVAVRILEDDPTFDAGHGSVLTEDMTVEVDAMIMDGNTLESGSNSTLHLVSAASNLCNAILCAFKPIA